MNHAPMPVGHRSTTRALALLGLVLAALAVLVPAASAAPTFGSGVTAVSNYDGRLEVFASDYDGDIRYMYQERSGNGWSSWRSLPFSRSFALARPAVGRNRDGRLELFAQSGTRMYHAWQKSAGGLWSGWSDFGGSFREASFTQPVVASSADGRMEVFAVDGNGRLAHRWQDPSGQWSEWRDRGGSFDRSAVPAVVRNTDGRLELFMIDVDGKLQHIWQASVNGGWSDWESLGGDLANGNGWGPAAGVNRDGRVEVFATTRSGRQLHHKWQHSASGSWSGWAQIPGATVEMPTAARNADGRLEVFARTSNGPRGGTVPSAIVHAYQLTPNGSWAGFSHLAGTGMLTYQKPTVAINSDGRLELFSQAENGASIQHAWQLRPNGGWSGFTPLVSG